MLLGIFKGPCDSKTAALIKTISRRCQKTPLWGPFSKTCVFGARNVVYVWTDGRNGEKKVSVSKISGYVWTVRPTFVMLRNESSSALIHGSCGFRRL